MHCVHFGVFRLNVENPNKIEATRKLDSTACTAPLISIDSMFVAILRPRNTINFVQLITGLNKFFKNGDSIFVLDTHDFNFTCDLFIFN